MKDDIQKKTVQKPGGEFIHCSNYSGLGCFRGAGDEKNEDSKTIVQKKLQNLTI